MCDPMADCSGSNVHNDAIRLTVKVIPGSSRSEFAGLYGDTYKIRINAPPEKGKANKALVDFLSEEFHIKKIDVQIQTGQTSRIKQILLRGVSSRDVQKHFTKT